MKHSEEAICWQDEKISLLLEILVFLTVIVYFHDAHSIIQTLY